MLSATMSWWYDDRRLDFQLYPIKSYEKSSFEDGWKSESKSDKDDIIYPKFLSRLVSTLSSNFWLIHFFEREKSTKMAMRGSRGPKGIKGWNTWVIHSPAGGLSFRQLHQHLPGACQEVEALLQLPLGPGCVEWFHHFPRPPLQALLQLALAHGKGDQEVKVLSLLDESRWNDGIIPPAKINPPPAVGASWRRRRPLRGDRLRPPSAETVSSDLEQRRPHAPEFAIISYCKTFWNFSKGSAKLQPAPAEVNWHFDPRTVAPSDDGSPLRPLFGWISEVNWHFY
jgi:hypothetical protein